MFVDINNNSKGVNPDFTTVLDQRDVVNRIAIDLMESHDLLRDNVEYGQSTRMSATNPNLLGAKTVADIIRGVIVGKGRVGARVESDIANNIVAYTRKASDFLDVLVASFPDLADVAVGRVDAEQIRRTTLLGSATMLRVLAMTYHELTAPDRSNRFSRAQVEEFFRKLDKPMKRIPIAEDDPLWMPTRAFLPGASAPQARQGTISALVDELVRWATVGHDELG